MNRGAKTLGVRTWFLLARHQFNPSWQQRTVWRDTLQPYKLETQNIAQLLLSLCQGLDRGSMTSPKGQMGLILQALRGEGSIPTAWLTLQMSDACLSHHLSVRHTLRMFTLALTARARKT